uniref:Methyltransferase n=1 Tax=uncultured Thiotrichaceae bacterium TaxID=298394 RepID=A0A6S6T9P7_9GAMM|nr:MAG: Methyltransferase [uncultured Thiotrichaceae bacterium]
MNYTPPPNKQAYYEQVWDVVRQIPHARVATYGQIAKILTKPEGISPEDYQLSASRWVGLAMAACPEDLQWHRVLNSQGKISHRPEAGKQRQLLEEEGLLFSKEKLDLNECQWAGPGQNEQPRQGRLF